MPASPAAAAAPWGGLQVVQTGERAAGESGGTSVVLLHGWGARGDDLVPLARSLTRPGSRFVVPAAPLSRSQGGRAWWRLNQTPRPEHALEEHPVPQRVHPAVLSARQAVLGVIRTVRERHAPKRLCVAGFSQGAMLALDVALHVEPPLDCVAVLSGLLLRDSLGGLSRKRVGRPRVFIAHGRNDPVLPFATAERARDMLKRAGFDVRWLPFAGAHSIPSAVRLALDRFLFG